MYLVSCVLYLVSHTLCLLYLVSHISCVSYILCLLSCVSYILSLLYLVSIVSCVSCILCLLYLVSIISCVSYLVSHISRFISCVSCLCCPLCLCYLCFLSLVPLFKKKTYYLVTDGLGHRNSSAVLKMGRYYMLHFKMIFVAYLLARSVFVLQIRICNTVHPPIICVYPRPGYCLAVQLPLLK